VVVYVDGSATGCATGNGSLTNPYCTVGAGLGRLGTGGFTTVLVKSGTYTENLQDTVGGSTGIIGQGTVVIDGSGSPGSAVVSVTGPAHVLLRNLTLANATGTLPSTSDGGVSCLGTLACVSGVTLEDDVVENNTGAGMFCSGCTCNVSRTALVGNQGGGALLKNAAFDFVNDVIAGNGSTTGTGGFYSGASVTGAQSTGGFENDTLVGNIAPTGIQPGVYAASSVTSPIAVYNCIVRGNTSAGTTFPGEMSAGCTPMNDDYEGGTGANASIDADPLFQAVSSSSPSWGEYHLQPTSPCIGVGSTIGAPPIDLDGRSRGSAIDLGAYQH
jgi:hypothetical protein